MKKLFIFPLLLISSVLFSQKSIEPFINSIQEEQIKQHVYTLAADSMEGRKTGQPGQKKAAEYIANYFRTHGLDSLQHNNYYQPFDLYQYNRKTGGIMYKSKGKWAKKYPFRSFRGGSLFSHNMTLRDTLQYKYLGYGRDIQKQDLSQNVIIVLLDENLGITYKNIQNIAAKTRAKAYVVMFDKYGHWRFNPDKHLLEEQKKIRPISSLLYSSNNMTLEKHHVKYTKKNEILSSFCTGTDSIFVAFAFAFEMKYLFNKNYKALKKLEKKIAKGKAKRDIELINDSAICIINTQKSTLDTIRTENVFAFVEGTDKKDEVVVVSAHYDHIGKWGKDKICNGADDNASGTVAVMEMARAAQAAAKNGLRPKRSLLFVALSAEEEGLIGSDHFVSNCPVPIENVALNINLDMVGRNREDSSIYEKTVYVIGKGKAKRYLRRKVKKLNKENEQLEVSTHPGLGKKLTWTFSSDHYRFKRYNIPFMCYFTGLHPDYHTPRDTPDKINYPKLTEITKLAFKSLWHAANTDKNIKAKVKIPKRQNFIDRQMN